MNKMLVGAIVLVLVILGAVLLTNNNASAPTTPPPSPTPTQMPSPTPSETPTPVQTPTPSPTDSGYTPSTLTINKGDTVKFVNNGTKAIWPASAPHPTHTDYPAFDPKKAIAVGQSWSFTFDLVGTWKYHDHLNATRFGSITVQ
jgi:plastocyanin